MRRNRVAAACALVLLCVASASSLSARATNAPRVLLVCSGTAGCPRATPSSKVYRSLQVAVDHASNGDWILVWPGQYDEAVNVAQGHGLTDGLHIRGMDRNGVVLDGSKVSGSGIHVYGVNNTWLENMTGQHYHVGSSNAFYWTGVDGYWGRYLSGFDNGDYGIYAYDSTCTGEMPCALAYVYGSYNADSGIYIGGCRDCHAVVTNSRAYKNAIGYSGTNAGGELVLMNSEWDHNGAGLVPNTLTSEPDPPQSGVTIANNYIHDNNDPDVPGGGFSGIAPLGVGIDIAGGSENIIRDNLIVNQKHQGVQTHWLFTPPINNQVVHNTFKHTAYAAGLGDADIAFDVTGVQNCVYGNVDVTTGQKTPATTDPPGFANLNSCGPDNPLRQQGRGVYLPGDPIVSLMVALNSLGITEKKHYSGPASHPDAQKSMDNPCLGVPPNPWCANGAPTQTPPKKSHK